MRIQNNDSAFNVWTNYSANTSKMKASMSKLSTGVIKNTDDPAGVGISERMRAQIKSTSMARQNTENGISMLQTTDSWMQKISDQLSRMKALAVEAGGIVSSADKANVQTEFKSLQSEITRITSGYTSAAKFNGLALLRGGDGIVDMTNDTVDQSKKLTVQIGADINQKLNIELVNLDKSNTTSIGEVEYFSAATDTQIQTARTAYETALNTGAKASLEATPGSLAAKTSVADYASTAAAPKLDANGKTLSEAIAEAAANGNTTVTFTYYAQAASTADATFTVGGVAVTVNAAIAPATIDFTKGHWSDVKAHQDVNTAAVTAAKKTLDDTLNGTPRQDDVKWSDVLTNYTVETDNVVGKLDVAITHVAKERAKIASQQVRIENTRDGLLSYEDNLTSAESKVRDIDMAKETTEFSKYQVLTQAANAMLAQANSMPQNVLQLLG